MSVRKGVLIDISKCIGCRACQVACKEWNDLPAEHTINRGTYENPPHLSGTTWNIIKFYELEEDNKVMWHFKRHGCHHCTDSNCLEGCPTGAIKRSPSGMVYIDQKICIGCKNCIQLCPFGIPHLNAKTGTSMKCTGCFDRVERGDEPACAKACPTGALTFGNRSQLLAMAYDRLNVLRKQGNTRASIYGEKELGGLGFFYILLNDPEFYGLPKNPKVVSKYFYNILSNSFIGLISAAVISLGAIFTFRDRRKLNNKKKDESDS